MQTTLDVEMSVLSHLMLYVEDMENYATPSSILKKEYFSDCRTRKVFEKMCEAVLRKNFVGETSLIDEESGIDREFIFQIMGTNPIVDIERYIKVLRDEYHKRKLSLELFKIANELENDLEYHEALQRLENVQENIAMPSTFRSFSDWADFVQDKDKLPVLATGVDFIDVSFNGGLECGQLVLISGEADAGKTALGIQMLKYISQSEPVLFFAFEFTLRKFISAQREIEGQDWRNDNLLIEVENNDLDMVAYHIKKANKEKGVRFFLIDSQMRLTCDIDGNEEKSETFKFFTLATLARKLEIVIVLIVQTSKKDPNTPIGSKKANHEADVFIRIEHEKSEDKDKPYSTTSRKISVIKNKQNGHIFTAQVGFNGFKRLFFDIEKQPPIEKRAPKENFIDAPEITMSMV